MNQVKKNIVFITHYNSMNGANQSLLVLLKFLQIENDIDIANVFVHNPKSESDGLVRELNKLNIPNVNVNLHSCLYFKSNILSFLGLPVRLLRSLFSLIVICKFLKRNPVDIVYSNSSIETYGVFIAKALKKKHIWHIREFGFKDYRARHLLGIRFKRRILNFSNVLIAISKSIESYICLPQKSRLVYNGIVSRPIAKSHEFFFDYKPLNKGIVNLGIIGLISETKNQKRAIEALSQLSAEGCPVKLQIWGEIFDKRYWNLLRDYIHEHKLAEQVEFKGFVADKAVIYGSTDILLMCSKNEAFGRVTVEAMSYGIPVVGYNGGGTTEIIKSESNGLLYDDISDTLESQIRRVISDELLYRSLRENALLSANLFSEAKYVSSISEIIKSELN